MPYNAGHMTVSHMIGLKRAQPVSKRTYHHGSNQQVKKSAESESPDEQSTLPANASAQEHLVSQLKSKLVNYMYFVDGDDKHLKQFCQSFADSPVDLPTKIAMINETIEMGKFKKANLSFLVAKLPAACQSLDELYEFIFPLYNLVIKKINEPADNGNNEYYINNLPSWFVSTITNSILNKLPKDDFFKLLKVKIGSNSVAGVICKTNSYDNDMCLLVKSFHQRLSQTECSQQQLDFALSILSNIIQRYKKTGYYIKGPHVLSSWILSSLTWILSKTETPNQTFSLFNECAFDRDNSDFIIKIINACSIALDVGIKRKEVRDTISKYFTIDPESRKTLFNKVDKKSRGKALYDLIELNLLPRDYVISDDDKELVFSYITSKLPVEKRNSVLADLYNHAETKLNKYLWPKPHTFSIFHSKPHLPENWITEIKKHIDVDNKEEVKQDVRPS